MKTVASDALFKKMLKDMYGLEPNDGAGEYVDVRIQRSRNKREIEDALLDYGRKYDLDRIDGRRASQQIPSLPTDRKRLIRMAADLPAGDRKRRAILSGLKAGAGSKTAANVQRGDARLYWGDEKQGRLAVEAFFEIVIPIGSGLSAPEWSEVTAAIAKAASRVSGVLDRLKEGIEKLAQDEGWKVSKGPRPRGVRVTVDGSNLAVFDMFNFSMYADSDLVIDNVAGRKFENLAKAIGFDGNAF